MNEQRIKTCVSRFDSRSYTRIQFLRAVGLSHSAHLRTVLTSPPTKKMAQTTCRRHGITCCSDWYDFHVSSDTGSSCRQLLWGLSDRATRRRRTCPVRPRSFLRYLCRQSRQYGHRLSDLSRWLSRWRCACITEHCSYYNECSCFNVSISNAFSLMRSAALIVQTVKIMKRKLRTVLFWQKKLRMM